MSASGLWKITMKTPMGAQVGTLELTSAGGNGLGGSMSLRGDSLDIRDGAEQGSEVTWSVRVKRPLPMTGHFVATVDGDRLSGTAKMGPLGDVTFEATRVPVEGV